MSAPERGEAGAATPALATARHHAIQRINGTTSPVVLADSLRAVLVDSLTVEQLRHLVAIAEARQANGRREARLSQAGAVELADMLVAGRRPTIGWWRRHDRGAA